MHRHAQRHGHWALAETLHAVIVALSDAKQKAQQGQRTVDRCELLTVALLEEVGSL
jgi:hypothetical protein